MGVHVSCICLTAYQPCRSLIRAGRERSTVITAAVSSTRATQPAVARLRYLFRCSSRLPCGLSIEYTLPIRTQPRLWRKSGTCSRARQGRGVQASFSQQQNQPIGRVPGDSEVAPPRRSSELISGRDSRANCFLDSPSHAAIMAQLRPDVHAQLKTCSPADYRPIVRRGQAHHGP